MNAQTPKEAAIQGILEFYRDKKEQWRIDSHRTRDEIFEERETLTVDDIKARCPPPDPQYLDLRVAGAIAVAGLKKVGETHSKRDICHRRKISVFAKPRTIERKSA